MAPSQRGAVVAKSSFQTPSGTRKVPPFFVHEDEAEEAGELAAVRRDRARKHARNAYWLVYEPEQLSRRAGQGIRQGFGDAGPLLRSVG